jgi:Protein of unknown function (DUF2442)
MSTSPSKLPPEPLATSISVTDVALTVELNDGRILSVPLAWYPRLLLGSHKERTQWRLIGKGHGIHWEALDEDIHIEGLIAGQRSSESQASIQRWLESRK